MPVYITRVYKLVHIHVYIHMYITRWSRVYARVYYTCVTVYTPTYTCAIFYFRVQATKPYLHRKASTPHHTRHLTAPAAKTRGPALAAVLAAVHL